MNPWGGNLESFTFCKYNWDFASDTEYQFFALPAHLKEQLERAYYAAARGEPEGYTEFAYICKYAGFIGEATEALTKGAESGACSVQYELGRRLHEFRNYTEGAEWFRKAAEQGHTKSQYQLGKCYFEGLGVPKDEARGESWLQKAAEKGDQAARGYLQKNQMEKDASEARKRTLFYRLKEHWKAKPK